MEVIATVGPATDAANTCAELAETTAPRPRPWWRRFRSGYAGWALLNLIVVAAVLLLDLFSATLRGLRPMQGALWLIGAGVVAQAAIWLVMIGPARSAPEIICRRLGQLSGGVSLVLALVVSILSPVGDIPGAIIALPPLIAVAFFHRPSFAISLAVLLGVLTLLPLRVLVRSDQPAQLAAAFNAGGLAVAGVVVAMVVSLLTAALRAETHRLRGSLTELRETRARLVAEEKLAAIGRLSAGIAHEIRNPVAMIASSLEMAAQDATPADTRAEMSRIAREEAGRLTRLTDDFLAYARGKPPQRRDVAAVEVLDYVAALVRARAGESGVIVNVDAPPALRASLDELQVHHALLNLITNALDATPHGGTVTLGARPANGSASHGTVDLFVENAGDPIPPESVARLFEPFFTTRPQGTGLGLPIAHRIAEMHGGQLLLERNEPGRVRFTLRLPRGASSVTEDGRM